MRLAIFDLAEVPQRVPERVTCEGKMTQTWSLRPGCIGESIPAPDGVSTHRIGNVTPTLRARPELVEGSAPCGSGVPAAFVAATANRRIEFLHSCRRTPRGALSPATTPVASAPAPPESGGELVKRPSSDEEGRRTAAGVVLNWKQRCRPPGPVPVPESFRVPRAAAQGRLRIRVYEIKVGARGCAKPKSLRIYRRECNSAGR